MSDYHAIMSNDLVDMSISHARYILHQEIDVSLVIDEDHDIKWCMMTYDKCFGRRWNYYFILIEQETGQMTCILERDDFI